ncbi:MAG: O-sialoglycoprotein endopeptidase [Bacillota bacterium]
MSGSPAGWVLGLDTSFYTTSAAAVDLSGRLLAAQRALLPVPPGERGLRPQEGVFLHVQALPGLLAKVLEEVRQQGAPAAPAAVAASVRPLPQSDSYLPVFRVSDGFGRSLAAAWQVPFLGTTHQEGHVMAGVWSAGMPLDEPFVAVHLSGGTTEFLDAVPAPDGFSLTLLGQAKDLHVGQFIDRIGVALGLPFPAGPSLEALAAGGMPGPAVIPSHAEDASLSFSGPEACALRLLAQGVRPADLAYGVQVCVARSVEKALRWSLKSTGRRRALVVGGVAANGFLRRELTDRLARGAGVSVYFARPELSTDNAVGVALLGRAAAAS